MVMSEAETKAAVKEVLYGLRCVVSTQLKVTDPAKCIPIIKKPVERFCDIARRSKIGRPSGFISPTLYDIKKMGQICSSKKDFPLCEKTSLGGWVNPNYIPMCQAIHNECARSVDDAIRDHPMERSYGWTDNVLRFDTIRDTLHGSGYKLPDYTWGVPRAMRSDVKKIFEKMSGENIKSLDDIDRLVEDVDRW